MFIKTTVVLKIAVYYKYYSAPMHLLLVSYNYHMWRTISGHFQPYFGIFLPMVDGCKWVLVLFYTTTYYPWFSGFAAVRAAGGGAKSFNSIYIQWGVEGCRGGDTWRKKYVLLKAQIFESQQSWKSKRGPCDRKAEILITAPTTPAHVYTLS